MSLANVLNQVRQLDNLNQVATIKECVAASYQWLNEAFDETTVDSLIEGRVEFVDTLLQKLWHLSALDQIPTLALVAVGGYGRGQLQPYSDIDLLLLSKQPLTETNQQQLRNFVALLWDTGLDIGHAVRNVQQTVDIANQDVTVATNLIESRILAGDESTFNALQAKVHSDTFISSADFFKAKLEEQHKRHAKFKHTSYNLEPNLKENPGCLRDIQTIGWVAKKHFRLFNGRELVNHDYITSAELQELLDCRHFLWRMRCALHLVSGRSENRLLFDYQPEVAKYLGFGNGDKSSVEALMKVFYRQVRRISELNQMLLPRFSQDILGLERRQSNNINADFALERDSIKPRHNNVFPTPLAIMQFLLILAQQPEIKTIDTDTLRQLRNARRTFSDHYWCEDKHCREVFVMLLYTAEFYDFGWDLAHKHGILQAYLPEWDHIAGMMQFDLFHAYTVDEHTHRLIKFIRNYYQCHDDSFSRCHNIVKTAERPELLFIAAIFHDIAKGRGGDHSLMGAQAIAQFCEKHQLESADSGLVIWLVEKHLLMSVVAQRRDIYDPDVISEFAAAVGNQRRLDFLYALTLADIRATNDNLWNDWKASLLGELYQFTTQALKAGKQGQQPLQHLSIHHQQKAVQALLRKGFEKQSIGALWRAFSDDYFTRFKPDQIAWHSQAILDAQQHTPQELVVEISNQTTRAGTELIIYGKDKFSLFAQVASVLDSRNCSIHDAQLMQLENGRIFDSFTLLEQDGSAIDNPQRIQALQHAIHSQLAKPGHSHTNNRRLSRQHRQLSVPTKVRFYPGRNNTSMMELEALDTPGLLAQISHILVEQKISLHMAKITTIGERAEDLFILSTLQGKALSQEQEVALKARLIAELGDGK